MSDIRDYAITDKARFSVWNEIHRLSAEGYGIAPISLQTGQTAGVVDYVLNGIPLNRIRCIECPGLKSLPVPAEWTRRDSQPVAQASLFGADDEPPQKPAEVIAPVDILAIDFLNLLVRAYHAGTKTDAHAVTSMFRTIAGMIRKLNPRRVVFCADGGYDHRTAIYPEYKANRSPMEEPLKAQRILAGKAILAAGFCVVRAKGYEADDVLASIAQQHPDTVIASGDKDLLGMHGRARIYHPWGEGQFVTPFEKWGINPGQVESLLALQGDSSDNIPGVKGIGEQTAPKLLQEHKDLEGVLIAATTGQIPGAVGRNLIDGRGDALISSQLVALVRNLQLPEITPWTPPPSWRNQLEALNLRSVVASLEPIAPESDATGSIPRVLEAIGIGQAHAIH